jgi:FkbM family methyltransferase
MAAKGVAARHLCGPVGSRIAGPFTRRHVRHYGLTIETGHPAFSARTRAELLWQVYEGAETRFVKRYLHGATTVLELGSGLGVASSHIASVMQRGGRLICVEANPDVLAGLRWTAESQGLAERVDLTVLHEAIADEPGSAAAIVSDEGHLGAHAAQPDQRSSRPRVPTTTLGDLVTRFGLDRYGLVSDIEGAEASFILSGQATGLERCDRAVFELHEVEYRGNRLGPEDLLEALADRHGFELLARRGPVVAVGR